jgi:formate dehydrogenase
VGNRPAGKRGRVRATPKGRAAIRGLAEVVELLGDSPRRRDLLIEFLHRIRIATRSVGRASSLAAEMKMAMAEVYEVATFYHHFDVVKDGEAGPPAITVRVRFDCVSLPAH